MQTLHSICLRGEQFLIRWIRGVPHNDCRGCGLILGWDELFALAFFCLVVGGPPLSGEGLSIGGHDHIQAWSWGLSKEGRNFLGILMLEYIGMFAIDFILLYT